MTSVNACFRFLQSRVGTKAEIKNRWHLPKCASCTVARTGCHTHSFKDPSQVPGVAVVMNSEQTSTAHWTVSSVNTVWNSESAYFKQLWRTWRLCRLETCSVQVRKCPQRRHRHGAKDSLLCLQKCFLKDLTPFEVPGCPWILLSSSLGQLQGPL